MSNGETWPRRCGRAALVSGVAVLAALVGACSGSDSSTAGSNGSDTTPASSTPTTEPPITAPENVECGTELPVFPTTLTRPDGFTDVDGTNGPAPSGVEPNEGQLVQHWTAGDDVFIEIRWPAGAGPDVDSPVVITQLIDTGRPIPCDNVRVLAYGPADAANRAFTAFVAGLEPSVRKTAYIAEERDALTLATDPVSGDCATPVPAELDDSGRPTDTAIEQLLGHYVSDRSNGAGFDSCFTIAGLRALDATLSGVGQPDIIRASGVDAEGRGTTVLTFLSGDPISVLSERLTPVVVPDPDGPRLAFGGVETGPDSLVGENEAVAYLDEFLTDLANRDYESAAQRLINPAAEPDQAVAEDVLAAMPDFAEDPTTALRTYCRTATCQATYKISDTLDFDASSRVIDVTFFAQVRDRSRARPRELRDAARAWRHDPSALRSPTMTHSIRRKPGRSTRSAH
jgi:hypothetical protein